MAEKISYRTSFAKAFHRTILVAYVFFTLYEDKIVSPPEDSPEAVSIKSFGGRFKYLTSINLMILQVGYFALAALNDLAGTNERVASKISFLQRVRDFLFTTIIFPMAIHVGSLFWGLYYADRSLIFPESYEPWYPRWANHIEHTLPSGVVLLEMLLVFHKFPKSKLVKVLPITLSFIVYFTWLLYLKFEKNIFVYPFFKEFSDSGLIAFLIASGIPAFFWLILGEVIHKSIWGGEAEQPKKKDRSKHKNNYKQGNNKKGGNNKKQNSGGKKGKENQQQQSSEVSKKQKNPDLESAKKKQKIIEEPEKNKKKQKNNDSDKKKKNPVPNSTNHQNFAKNKNPKAKANQDSKNTKANKKNR